MLELKATSTETVPVSAADMETALFETILVRKGQPVFLDRHLSRMAAGLVFMKMDTLPENSAVRKAILHCLSLTGTVNGAVKLVAAGRTLYVLPRTAAPVPASIAIGISKIVVRETNSSLAGIKTVQRNWSDALGAEAARTDVFDCVALNEQGHLTEGGRTNLFLVQNDRLVTPPLDDSCLPGITRSIVFETGKVKEQTLKKKDLIQCEAVFLTNALIGAVPVSRITGIGRKQSEHPLIQEVQAQIERAILENLNALR
ncbi:MAG: aminotransferase class IV [Holophagae bacterium]|nr:aminotransferase class IV [Holophagae bacterium]